MSCYCKPYSHLFYILYISFSKYWETKFSRPRKPHISLPFHLNVISRIKCTANSAWRSFDLRILYVFWAVYIRLRSFCGHMMYAYLYLHIYIYVILDIIHLTLCGCFFDHGGTFFCGLLVYSLNRFSDGLFFNGTRFEFWHEKQLIYAFLWKEDKVVDFVERENALIYLKRCTQCHLSFSTPLLDLEILKKILWIFSWSSRSNQMKK